jgi:hypothetical protein
MNSTVLLAAAHREWLLLGDSHTEENYLFCSGPFHGKASQNDKFTTFASAPIRVKKKKFIELD